MLPLLLALALPAHARKPAPPPPLPLAETAARLRESALASDEAYEELRVLADQIGARLSGSKALEEAVAWGADNFHADGLLVALEPVTVPNWKRGKARLVMTEPRAQTLDVLALGGTASTPAWGISAPVLVVSDFDELRLRADEAAGRIVVYDAPFTTYGETVRFRWDGANHASRAGAVASLVRSVTTTSLGTLHTGGMGYDDDTPAIPHGAISIEHATMLHRLQEAGITPSLDLHLEAHYAPEAHSFNVVGELRGSTAPDEIVVLGCHLDSWDVGQGAQDDGAGCVVVMEAVAQLAALPRAPRRTVRAVLYTNEENGLAGGRAYAKAHAGERIVAAVEDDTGAGRALGFRVDVRSAEGVRDEEATARLIEHLTPHLAALAPVEAAELSPGYGGADIGPLSKTGTVGFGLNHDMAGYWPVHHTEADTFDKIDPALMKRNVAAMTVFAWILAEHEIPVDEVAGTRSE